MLKVKYLKQYQYHQPGNISEVIPGVAELLKMRGIVEVLDAEVQPEKNKRSTGRASHRRRSKKASAVDAK
jgi:hypothetical protein